MPTRKTFWQLTSWWRVLLFQPSILSTWPHSVAERVGRPLLRFPGGPMEGCSHLAGPYPLQMPTVPPSLPPLGPPCGALLPDTQRGSALTQKDGGSRNALLSIPVTPCGLSSSNKTGTARRGRGCRSPHPWPAHPLLPKEGTHYGDWTRAGDKSQLPGQELSSKPQHRGLQEALALEAEALACR